MYLVLVQEELERLRRELVASQAAEQETDNKLRELVSGRMTLNNNVSLAQFISSF